MQISRAPIWGLVVACSVVSACTILFDSERMQCTTDSDCRAVGLLNGTCIENVCQPLTAMAPPSQTMTTPGLPSAGLGGTSTPTAGAVPQAPSAGNSGLRPTRGNAGETVPRAGNISRSSDEDGGAIVTGTSGTAGAATPCAGPTCPCSGDNDCVARGIAGGTCVEGRCWEPETQCEADEDCLMRGPEFAGGRCQNKQCEPNPRVRCDPPPPVTATDTREIILPVIDALALRYIANVPIVACNKLDYACANPIAMADTDMAGDAKLMVPANFAGYMQQTERNDYVQAMYFMPVYLPADGRLSNFPLVPNGSFGGLALALGTSVDRSRGHAMLIIEDCQGLAMSGIRFSTPQADMATSEFYVIDQIPTTSATETPPEGDGGFANLPEGVVEITATETKTGLVVNKVSMLIRAGAITTAYIKPAARGSTTTGRFPLGP